MKHLTHEEAYEVLKKYDQLIAKCKQLINEANGRSF